MVIRPRSSWYWRNLGVEQSYPNSMDHPLLTPNLHCKLHDYLLKTFLEKAKLSRKRCMQSKNAIEQKLYKMQFPLLNLLSDSLLLSRWNLLEAETSDHYLVVITVPFKSPGSGISIGRNFACNNSIVFKFGMDHPLITPNHHCKFHDDQLKTFWRRPKYLGNGASNQKMP